ncbi:MAG: transcription-repair coupling factor [Hyphomicrobiales bacterium]|nr:transcription-repair coupling factor [Hyphomicrobiales bacterium]
MPEITAIKRKPWTPTTRAGRGQAFTRVEALANGLARGDHLRLVNAPDGFDALAVAEFAYRLSREQAARAVTLVHLARDGQRCQRLADALGFVAPGLDIVVLPAWDCQPYDRVSPNAAIAADRMLALARLATGQATPERPRILLTTVNAILQRVPTRATISRDSFSARPGNALDLNGLAGWLESNGYLRAGMVRDVGDYAVRGGILDLWPSTHSEPVRLDFFGDTLESIRSFDAQTQRSTGQLHSLDLVPLSEVRLTSESIKRFRTAYVTHFGNPGPDDALYEAVSEGRRYPGLEHWLPLFHEGLDTVFDFTGDAPLVIDHLANEAAHERIAQILDYQRSRASALEMDAAGGAPYRPLPADALYVSEDELRERLAKLGTVTFSPFSQGGDEASGVFDAQAHKGRDFAPERADPSANVFDSVIAHARKLRAEGRSVLIVGWSEGSRERLETILADHGLTKLRPVSDFAAACALADHEIGIGVWGLEEGFETANVAVIGEQDILGDRLVRSSRRSRKAKDVISEASALTAGDIVVHVDHGIGRFVGLATIQAMGAPHACLELHYAGGDKLFLPVENIELLSRYGSEDAEAQLDKLGGLAWQSRKARLKQRIREMAGKLIDIAAARALKEAPVIVRPEGLASEFEARFPYQETDDQLAAIEAVTEDLGAGKPMDRLICGDVGFGKTEVALRAAFAVAMAGLQAAIVVPTTLLARQHYATFKERFAGLPLKIAQASRFVGSSELKAVKLGVADGTIDIVIGTHALLGKSMRFKRLGLVVIDEEQHFGVAHKERLKELRAEVHVLTLSATPIPRTLQLALTGVRELSIIATPPIDRLAVRSFVSPFDPLTIREALLRERYRGGQSFYVCPHIEDIAEIRAFLDEQLPELKVAVAHGQIAAGQLEDVMSAFYDGKYDVLLSTAIVESGLDIPRANTLIVHRADQFGLAQLYQLRGRVGRSKTRAYALFTIPPKRKLTQSAERRLKVLQSLDTLGAGFQLASHDLDIRGAGNLLGEEQSGHIKEVGYELYQHMLEEAVASLKSGVPEAQEDTWSPTIQLGTPVMIPESYVADLDVRLSLYRELSLLAADEDVNAARADLRDRFGPLPSEVDRLLDVIAIKTLCRRANVERVEAGPKGIIIAFRNNEAPNPEGLISYIAEQGSFAKVRPDMRIVFLGEYEDSKRRLAQVNRLLRDLVRVAERKKAA